MKNLTAVKILICTGLLFISPNMTYPSTLGDIRLSYIEGDVQVRQGGTSDFLPVTNNMPLMESANLWVPQGAKAEIQLRDGTSIRLNERSSLQVLEAVKNSYHFNLHSGHLYVNFRRMHDTFLQLDTSIQCSVRTFDQSIFAESLTGEGFFKISVSKGTVDVEENESGKTTKTLVTEGKAFSFGPGKKPVVSPIPPPGDWESWNIERDKKLYVAGDSERRLPDELKTYSSDFENNGKWVRVEEHGEVWTPNASASPDWAPYRNGRWTWIGSDYVWVSYDPWGWVPYHYGRWSYVSSVGWCWVPAPSGAVFWGPGYVGWVSTPTYVAWVPLAPGEIYYGYGNYGPGSVNIRNVNINRITVNKVVYKNTYAVNSVTALSRSAFVTGRGPQVRLRDNPFLTNKIVGSPRIRPERSTLMPVIKDIPQFRRPPQEIVRLSISQLKQTRPLVRERNQSVLLQRKVERSVVRKPILPPPERPKPPRAEVQKPRPFDRKPDRPGSLGTGFESQKPRGQEFPKSAPLQVKPGMGEERPGQAEHSRPKKQEVGKPPEH
jgi:hypothetical protein